MVVLFAEGDKKYLIVYVKLYIIYNVENFVKKKGRCKVSNINKIPLFDNINLYVIKDSKYKTVHYSMFLHTILKRENVTKNSLLSRVLKSATKSHPSMREMSIYAESLFGCAFDAGVLKRANIQSVYSTANIIADRFTKDASECLAAKLMLDIMFDPFVQNDGFSKEITDSQKSNLKDDIEGLINDKRAYANVRCIEEMCKDEPNAVVEIGYLEDLDDIDEKNLYEYYKSIIFSNPIDIFVVGDVDSEELTNFFKNYFSKISFNIAPHKIVCTSKSVSEIKNVEDNLDVNQGKLAMGFRTGVNVESDLYYPLLVGNSIFGSGAHSKLFNNVREKMSLCYYAYSRLDKHNAIMLVGSGIEFENFEKTKNAVIDELEKVRKGDFTREELDVAKEYIINSYKSYEDSPGLLVDYYLGKTFTPGLPSLARACDIVSNVTKEDVLKSFEKISLDTVYFLNGKEEK